MARLLFAMLMAIYFAMLCQHCFIADDADTLIEFTTPLFYATLLMSERDCLRCRCLRRFNLSIRYRYYCLSMRDDVMLLFIFRKRHDELITLLRNIFIYADADVVYDDATLLMLIRHA